MSRVGRFAVAVGALVVLGCGNSDHDTNGDGSTLAGTAFGQPFVVRDVLLVHPKTWKSAAAGSTAILVSDTPDLCAQISSGKTTAPGRLITVSLEQRGADGSVEDLSAGSFTNEAQGTPSSRYGAVFLSEVDAKCTFDKLFTDQSSIQVTSVGSNGSPLMLTIQAHFTSGDSLQGGISAATGCDETAVDDYLNRSPGCG